MKRDPYDDTKPPLEDGFSEFSKHFTFIKNIGSGTFGKVVLATYKADGKNYAVKVGWLVLINIKLTLWYSVSRSLTRTKSNIFCRRSPCKGS